MIGSMILSSPKTTNSVFQGDRSTAKDMPSRISDGPRSLPIASMASLIRASVLSIAEAKRDLSLYIENLPAAILSGIRIYAVRTTKAAVSFLGKLRLLKAVRTATLSAALFGLFSFWLSHN